MKLAKNRNVNSSFEDYDEVKKTGNELSRHPNTTYARASTANTMNRGGSRSKATGKTAGIP